jgi:hypothetical protein
MPEQRREGLRLEQVAACTDKLPVPNPARDEDVCWDRVCVCVCCMELDVHLWLGSLCALSVKTIYIGLSR